jgi:ABC-2 type transport system ATP-binding protein
MALRERFEIEAVASDGVVRFERAGGHAFVPLLFESVNPGLIDSITVGRPTLEDVFLRLTGRRFETSS